jgi:hypothetical protein
MIDTVNQGHVFTAGLGRRARRLSLLAVMLLGLALAAAPAAAQADADGDGLFDDDEATVYGTNPRVFDTDGDGSGDGEEVYLGTNPLTANAAPVRADSDGDGLYDDDETAIYGTNATLFDTDGDGIGDGDEIYAGTNANVPDAGIPGYEEADCFGNVLIGDYEVIQCTLPDAAGGN